MILQHGIVDSADYALAQDDLSMAFIFADKGYDIWLPNTRGNKYSRSHLTMTPYQKEFWDFSFYEMVQDTKAVIEYVLYISRTFKVGYIGHSQGTSSMFTALGTDRTWFEQRVNIFIALAPVTRLQNVGSTLLRILFKNSWILNFFESLGFRELAGSNFITRTIFRTGCGWVPLICKAYDYFTANSHPGVEFKKYMQTYFAHYPAGTSMKSVKHYVQIHKAGKFQLYDYGKIGNNKHYGDDTPPEINLKGGADNIRIVLMPAEYDVLSDISDSVWLRDEIFGNDKVGYYTYKYGHLSFFMAEHTATEWMNDAWTELQKYHPPQ